MAKSLTPVSHDGMTGVQLSGYTTQEILDKATALAAVYETPSKIFLSGSMAVSVQLDPGQWVEVSYDNVTQDFTFDWSGLVHAKPFNGTTWDLAEVMITLPV